MVDPLQHAVLHDAVSSIAHADCGRKQADSLDLDVGQSAEVESVIARTYLDDRILRWCRRGEDERECARRAVVKPLAGPIQGGAAAEENVGIGRFWTIGVCLVVLLLDRLKGRIEAERLARAGNPELSVPRCSTSTPGQIRTPPAGEIALGKGFVVENIVVSALPRFRPNRQPVHHRRQRGIGPTGFRHRLAVDEDLPGYVDNDTRWAAPSRGVQGARNQVRAGDNPRLHPAAATRRIGRSAVPEDAGRTVSRYTPA